MHESPCLAPHLGQDLAAAFGCRLREARRARRMSQTELAEAVGQPQTSISAYERGARVPDLCQLDRLARAAGVSVGWLASGKLEPDEREPLTVPGVHIALGGVDLSGLPDEEQANITNVVRFLVLLARERAQLGLDAADQRRLPQIRNLLQDQPPKPHERRYRSARRA